jgi:hypothetical protein
MRQRIVMFLERKRSESRTVQVRMHHSISRLLVSLLSEAIVSQREKLLRWLNIIVYLTWSTRLCLIYIESIQIMAIREETHASD